MNTILSWNWTTRETFIQMNNYQIEAVLNAFDAGSCFRGVYPADMLPSAPSDNESHAYVVNTDNSNEPGKHWVGFFFPRFGHPEYFDSYGLIPLIPHFYDFLGDRDFFFNNVTLQAPFSNVCGQYCIFFIIGRISGISFETLMKLFDRSNPHKNDGFVNSFVNDIFGMHLKKYDENFLQKQISNMFQPQEYY